MLYIGLGELQEEDDVFRLHLCNR